MARDIDDLKHKYPGLSDLLAKYPDAFAYFQKIQRANEVFVQTLDFIHGEPNTANITREQIEVCARRVSAILTGQPEPDANNPAPAPPAPRTGNIVPFPMKSCGPGR